MERRGEEEEAWREGGGGCQKEGKDRKGAIEKSIMNEEM